MASKLTIPSVSSAKDPGSYPLFKGDLTRWLWKLYAQRLTHAGRWFAAVTAIFVAYGGASLNYQGYVLAGYAAAIWLIALLAMAALRPRVRLTASFAPRVRVGETLPVEIELTHLRRSPAGDLVVVPHQLPAAIDAVPESGVFAPAAAKSAVSRFQLGLQCRRRGKHIVPGFRVESVFPFGILRSRLVFPHERALLVYPKFTPLTDLRLPMSRRYQPGGVAMTSQVGESFEYLGNREYRDGDNPRDIDWRATARAQRPIVREWVEEYMLRIGVILDTHVPRGSGRERADAFERAVSLAAAVSDYMARQDYLVDLFAAGPNLYHLTAGRSLAHLEQILDILACVDANPDEPFSVIEPQISLLLGRISTVACVMLDWNDTRRQFVDHIRRQGVAVKVIVVRDSQDIADDSTSDVLVISREEFERGISQL